MKARQQLILAIDDSIINLNLLSTLLKREGYKVLAAQSGSIALRIVEKKLPDLVLLDIKMPDMDGYEVCYHLKSNDRTKGIPIIFISSLNDPEEIIKAFNAGCIDYVTKPIQTNEMLARIKTHIELNSMRQNLKLLNLQLEKKVKKRTRELEEANKLLKESEERWQFALEGSGDGIWDWNLITNEVFFSKRWKEMLKYSTEDMWVTYEEWTKHIHPDDVGWVTDAIQLHLSGTTSGYRSEHRVICKDGSYIWVLSRGKVISSINGKPSRMVGTHTDITARKKNEESLIKAKDEAEIANRLKSEFLANMSHEIRTPMNAILGFSEILKDKVRNDPEVLDYLSGIQKSGNSLIDLINDILDLAKIEAGRLDIVYSPVNLFSMITEIKQIFSLQTTKKKLDFEITIDENLPKSLLLDELRLRQVLFNLIGNAVKFTENGSIHILVKSHIKDLNPGSIDLDIEIEDTGIGISARDIDKIFDPFKQQQGQNTLRYGGSGLGLSITKRLVEMMKGSIFLESQPGIGSKFSIKMKDIHISTKPVEQDIEVSIETYHKEFIESNILLIEDIESNRKVVTGFLENCNLKIVEAVNGKIAIEMLKEQKFDLILMDMQMPVMNGKETSLHIKQHEGYKKIPIIVITAFAMKEDILEIQTFADGYLTKPINKSSLLNEISRFIPTKASEQDETTNQSPKENFLQQVDTLINENKLPQEFIANYKKWFMNSEIARRSLNTNRLNFFISDLKSLSEKYEVEIFINFSELLIQLIESFSISQLSNKLNELEIVYNRLK